MSKVNFERCLFNTNIRGIAKINVTFV